MDSPKRASNSTKKNKQTKLLTKAKLFAHKSNLFRIKKWLDILFASK